MPFFKIDFFQKKSECQMVLIQIKSDVLSVLIRVQTVCKDYQQTTKFTPNKVRVTRA